MVDNKIKNYNKLCDKAKMIIGEHCLSNPYYAGICEIDDRQIKLTPIEQIMYYGLEYFNYKLSYIFQNIKIKLNFETQTKIRFGEKTYYADFVIRDCVANGELYVFTKPLIIECDGYESHSTRQQFNNDNERENNLKLLGYSILRFTGSKIYNDVIDCLENMIFYIFKENEKLFNMCRGE